MVAVTVNVTVTGQTSAGYVAVGPTITATPNTSTINFPDEGHAANGATVPLDDSGRLAAVFKGAADARTHLVIDVTGYFTDADERRATRPVTPARILDTRTGTGLANRFVTGSRARSRSLAGVASPLTPRP